MGGVRRYQDFDCWKLSNELKRRVYDFTAKSPASLDFKFCDQIRDSARSAPRNIAEGFGRFRNGEFARYLEYARGSLMETHNHLSDGLDLKYLTSAQCRELQKLANRAIGATTELWKYLRSDAAKRYH